MTELLDTNVILRYLVGDDPLLQKTATKYFEEAEKGKRTLLVKSIIIAECCFVLESFYKKTKDDIADNLEVLISQKWLRVDEREVLLRVMQYYRTGDHFVDSYLRAVSQSEKIGICSFDQKLLHKVS